MTSSERSRVMIALLNAYEWGILAGGAYDTEQRRAREERMINRLKHAVENAGFDMVPRQAKKKAA